MILVKVDKKDNKLERIAIKGHANYDEFGKDIVCASVSSIAICTVNAIYSFDDKLIKIIEEEGNLVINVLSQDEVTVKLLNNMIRCFKELERDYPDNIKIK